MPEGVADAPDVPEYLAWVWLAFWRLQTSHPRGAMGGVFPLPFDVLDRYATRYGIAGDAFEDFLFYMDTLEAIYLAHANKKD